MADQTDLPDPSEKTFVMSASSLKPDGKVADDVQSRIGQMFGEFKLIKRLGVGGMAEVWLAEQAKPRRRVALKFMHPDLMGDPLYVKRFEREADAAAGLTHANIVQVFSTGTIENQHYIVQEYVEGQTLRDYLKKLASQNKKISVNAALQVLRQTASALETAAAQGIVHRDIKPENIMLTDKGAVKVADFGLAQFDTGGEKLNLTQADTTMGTPLYMSPEQIRAEKLDQRSDLYSFGVTAYHMLCGQPPFKGETAMAVAVQHLNDPPAPLLERRTDLPKPLADLVHKLLRKKPEERYQSFTEVLEDIRTLSKANKTGTLAEVAIADGEPEVALPPARRLLGKRPWLTLSLLALLTGSASAGVGWLIRDRIGPATEARFHVDRMASAEAQYIHAMFLVNDEDAWKAVPHYFGDDLKEKVWVERAEEQLLLFYLKDTRRGPQADAQIEKMKQMRGDKDRLFVIGRFGEAYRAAGKGDRSVAKSIADTEANRFIAVLDGPWATMLDDLRTMLMGGPPRSSQPQGPPR
jgi:serine/threonine-protein kinase